jgi:hypothetical protein
MKDYEDLAPTGYVITPGGLPEKISERVIKLPWSYF